jgi:thymidylate synthase (FAD)
METIEQYHIPYTKPKVTLLGHSGLGVSEIASRTCYDSFEASEHEEIRQSMEILDKDAINAIESSELLDSLAWVHHHHSIFEHATISYLIQGTSRGVLQEHARHRIQAISVRSTRYTMSSLINAFTASLYSQESYSFFFDKVQALDLFVIEDEEYAEIEIRSIYDKLIYQYQRLSNYHEIAVAKSSLPLLEKFRNDPERLFEALERGKKKRNVGDAFKHIVSDNWRVDMVVTFNLRSLKNYFSLRASNSAYFQIRWLAQEMIRITPNKYLRLIIKEDKLSKMIEQ